MVLLDRRRSVTLGQPERCHRVSELLLCCSPFGHVGLRSAVPVFVRLFGRACFRSSVLASARPCSAVMKCAPVRVASEKEWATVLSAPNCCRLRRGQCLCLRRITRRSSVAGAAAASELLSSGRRGQCRRRLRAAVVDAARPVPPPPPSCCRPVGAASAAAASELLSSGRRGRCRRRLRAATVSV